MSTEYNGLSLMVHRSTRTLAILSQCALRNVNTNEAMEDLTFLPAECVAGVQCVYKVFTTLHFYHVLLHNSLILKWNHLFLFFASTL